MFIIKDLKDREKGKEKMENGRRPLALHEVNGPRGVSQVWQGKELRKGIFGCVANKGVAGEIVEVWQGKELAEFGIEAGVKRQGN